MGLTRLAQDPWSESHTVPTYVPPPFEVKSSHVPLTAERAEELVKTHLERNGQSLGRDQQQPVDSNAGRATADGSPSQELPGLHTDSNDRHSHRHGALAIRALPPVGISLYTLGPYDIKSPTLVSCSGAEAEGNARRSELEGVTTPMGTAAQRKRVDPKSADAWVQAAAQGTGHNSALSSTAAGSPGVGARCSPKTPNGAAPLSRRLSCPEGLMNIQADGPDGGGADLDPLAVAAAAVAPPRDALEPLANHHLWMYNRGRCDSGGLGLLYSASGVLRGESHNDRMPGGWRAQDAASIISVRGGGDWEGLPAKSSRLGRLMHGGGTPDAVRHLAAVIIQSYCRGWQVRRRVARMRAERRGEEAARQNAEAAAAALARERGEVRRRLRVAAKDCLLAVQAQQDYERTRMRLAAGRGLGPGAAAVPPPPPPSIPHALWERCKVLGQDPIQVLLDGGMLSQQIEEIIAASQLATQLPKRAAAVAVRLGVSPSPEPSSGAVAADGGSGGGGGSPLRNSFAGGDAASAAAAILTKGGSASDDGGAGVAAASTGAAAATAMPLPRRLSLPGRAAVPLPRVAASIGRQSLGSGQGSGSGQGLQSTPMASTSQLVEQLLVQQRLLQPQPQQQQQLQQQHLRQLQDSVANVGGGGGGGGMGMAQVQTHAGRRGSKGSMPAALAAVSQPLLRRQPSPSRGSVPADLARMMGLAGAATSLTGPGAAASPPPRRGPSLNFGQQLPAALQPQISPPHPHPGGGVGGKAAVATQSYGIPPGMGRRNSRRMSDFVGSSGSSNSGAAVAACTVAPALSLPLSAVGSSAMVPFAEQRFPSRTRSLGPTDSSVAAGALVLLPPQPPPAPMRVMLPAVLQPGYSGNSAKDATVSGVAGGDDDGNGFASSSSPAAAMSAACGLQGQSQGVAGQAHSLTKSAPSQQQQQRPSRVLSAQLQPQPLQPLHVPPVPGAASSPASGLGKTKSESPSGSGSALRRRHSFAETTTISGLPSSGPSTSSSSLSVGGAPTGTSAAAAAGAAVSVSGAAAGEYPVGGGSVVLASLNRVSSGGDAGSSSGRSTAAANIPSTSLYGGTASQGGAAGGGPVPAVLPPLTQSYGSLGALFGGGSGSGGSSGTSSPSMSVTATPQGSAIAAYATSLGDLSVSRARRGSNLAPMAPPPLPPPPPPSAAPGGAAPVVTAAPPPGVPPASGSPILLRRLQSLTSNSASTSGAAAAAVGSATAAAQAMGTVGGDAGAAAAGAASGGGGEAACGTRPQRRTSGPPLPVVRSPLLPASWDSPRAAT